jgi:hypothetical protein
VNLYLDIETLPSRSPDAHAAIAADITPPGNYKKPESIAQWEAEQKPALVKEAIAKTSFDGSVGHVCCIGWAFDDEPARHVMSIDSLDEADVLTAFIDATSAKVDEARNIIPTVIGHNVIGFDLRFLWQRAMVLGVGMPNWFPRDPKPWDGTVFDTMLAWHPQRDKQISLDRLCRALGVPGKDEVDGSMVAQMWADGKFSEIADYCRADVERTRNVHRKMRVAYGEAA